jgi:hypothetical protein
VRKLAVILAIITLPRAAPAADVYLIQGLARGQTIVSAGVPETIVWSTDSIFYNSGTTDAQVQLLAMSNGSLPPGAPTDFVVPAGRSTSLSARGLTAQWQPVTGDTLWVLHLDVPVGIIADDALFVRAQSQQQPNPTFNPLLYKYGKIRLPVFTALVPANQPQVNLMTSLGDPQLIPSHLNVAIYNGGTVSGIARIDVHRHCDDAIVESRTALIAANTIQQIYGLPGSGTCPGTTLDEPPSSVYTIVTVDQPSLTTVSTIANNHSPVTSMSITAPQ